MNIVSNSVNIIKKTNGDILGIFLFIIIIIYFLNIEHRNYTEDVILYGSIIGLFVDMNTVIAIS